MAGTSNVYGGHGPAGDVGFNYIPLIDVTFNLIIFFVLTSVIDTGVRAKVVLPKPENSQAEPSDNNPAPRITVNVLSSADEKGNESLDAAIARVYMIDTERIELGNTGRLVQRFKDALAAVSKTGLKTDPDNFFLEVRADQRVNYMYIEPILRAAQEAKIKKMNITALTTMGMN
jgi:biopolymer transport protein ExbD